MQLLRTFIQDRFQQVLAPIELVLGLVCAAAFAFQGKFGIARQNADPYPWIARQAEVVDCADVCVHLCGGLEIWV
jgi:hypothetical protein